ncbi:dihydrofolate reductase family protein [Nocardia heshunensis]
MRKLIESTLVSLDGVVESPEEWANPFFDAENKRASLRQLADYDAMLLGRVTYEKFLANWSGITGDEYFETIGRMRKYVASSTLEAATWNATLLTGDLVDAVRELKRQPGKDIIKYGTSGLDRPLIENGLVDGFRFAVMPVVVGHGGRLFDGVDPKYLGLKLTNTTTFDNGVVALEYVPVL